jgi:hypothetical protein
MDLSDFVKQTLVQINEGVVNAQAAIPGAVVNPHLGPGVQISSGQHGMFGTTLGHIQLVEFDVALTVGTSLEGSGGGSLKVLGLFDVGAKAQSASESQSVSRIKFAIPMKLPLGRSI